MFKKRLGFTKKAELEQLVKELLKAKDEKEIKESFGKIYELCEPWVKGVIRAYVHDNRLWDIINSDDIEDIVAKVFRKLYPNGTNRGLFLIKDPSKATSFIYITTINVIKRRVSKKKGKDALDRAERLKEYEYNFSYRISLQEIIEREERKQIINNAWNDLSCGDWKSAYIVNWTVMSRDKKKITEIARLFHTTYSKTFEKRKTDYKRLRKIIKDDYGIKSIFDL